MGRWRGEKRNNCDGEEREREREEGEEGRSRRWPVSAKDFGAAKWLRFRSPRQPSDHFVVLVCPLALRLAPVPSYRPSCWSSTVLRCQSWSLWSIGNGFKLLETIAFITTLLWDLLHGPKLTDGHFPPPPQRSIYPSVSLSTAHYFGVLHTQPKSHCARGQRS